MFVLWAVISCGFIIRALAGGRLCPYLKSYFQCTLLLWLVLWLINNKGDRGISVSVKRSGATTCLCVPSCFSFSKATNGPRGDASLSRWRTNPDVITVRQKAMMLCQTIVFCVNGSFQLLHRMCVDLDSLSREAVLTCVTSGGGVIIGI